MNTGNNQHASNDGPLPRRPRRRVSAAALTLGLGAGVVMALVAILVVAIARRGPIVPVIKRDDLARAERLWDDQGPASYNMDLTIGGRQPGVVHIEVRDGKVTQMTRDGVTPSQSRTWEYWTVPEQFETIRQDFDSAETAGGFGAPPGTQTILKAAFDPRFGYPRRYERYVLGTNLDVEWAVTRFEAVH